MKKASDSRKYDGMQNIGSDVYLRWETVEQEQQHHNDAARTNGCHAHKKTGHQSDQRHAHESLCRWWSIGDSLFDFFLQQQQQRNHDEQNTYRSLDEAVDTVAIQVP